MNHEFDLAFNLLDEAADRIQQAQYGITRILFHNHGDILLTTIHEHAPETGHRLVLVATDDHGHLATVEATAPDLDTTTTARILTVRAGHLTFHATPTAWTYPATDDADTTYTLTAGIGDEPMWTIATNHGGAVAHQDLDHAMAEILYAAV
jgi:hypothetical protein